MDVRRIKKTEWVMEEDDVVEKEGEWSRITQGNENTPRFINFILV